MRCGSPLALSAAIAAHAPGTGTTVPGGVNYREAQLVMDYIERKAEALSRDEFLGHFAKKVSPGFDPDLHLDGTRLDADERERRDLPVHNAPDDRRTCRGLNGSRLCEAMRECKNNIRTYPPPEQRNALSSRP